MSVHENDFHKGTIAGNISYIIFGSVSIIYPATKLNNMPKVGFRGWNHRESRDFLTRKSCTKLLLRFVTEYNEKSMRRTNPSK